MPGGHDWSILIVLTDPEDEASAVTFQPDVPGGTPGTPLIAEATDLVGWNNKTPQYHQPWQADSSFQPLANGAMTNEIPPWQNSSSAFVVATPTSGNTIFYICNAHPDEHGTIDVVV